MYRSGLWLKWEMGMKGKLWRVLVNFYKQVQNCVLIGNVRTNFFDSEAGLRQGCVLSPILFALFINDLILEIDQLNCGAPFTPQPLSLLLFADDIVLISDKRDNAKDA